MNELEISITISSEEQLKRKNICQQCDNFVSDTSTNDIIDAVTGVKETITTVSHHRCNLNNYITLDNLSSKIVECPESKW